MGNPFSCPKLRSRIATAAATRACAGARLFFATSTSVFIASAVLCRAKALIYFGNRLSPFLVSHGLLPSRWPLFEKFVSGDLSVVGHAVQSVTINPWTPFFTFYKQL